jgi:predicted Zn-dependent peptidase
MKKKIGMGTGYEGTQFMYNNLNFQKYDLDNGIQVWLQKPEILIRETGSLIVTLPCVGSKDDPVGQYGIAHFAEHLLFKGNRRRTFKEIISKIEERGGEINGETNSDHTDFYVNVDDFKTANEVLSGMLKEYEPNPDILRKESDVIIVENSIELGDESNRAREVFFKNYYSRYLDHMIGGPIKDIRKVDVPKMKRFLRNYYGSNNMSIVCGGKFSKKKNVLEILNNHFGDIKKSGKNGVRLKTSEVIRREAVKMIKLPELSGNYLYLSYFFPKVSRKDFLILCLISDLLGEKSNLYFHLRERGIVYGVDCSVASEGDITELIFNCSTKYKNFDFVIASFLDFLKNIDQKEIIKKQKAAQLSRLNRFVEAVAACKLVSEELAKEDEIISISENIIIKDSITLDEVFDWKKRLLENPPLILKVIPK